MPTTPQAACACVENSRHKNPQLSIQPARNSGRQRRTAAKSADTLFFHAPCRQAQNPYRRRQAPVGSR
ncbi:hypothetical protein, partial [Klebsiella pneumoniae]|uniref:hypothetical protein n=1 Tax=Klebsiella pneumoniae TaxID=573 RepID=UPI0027304422